MCEELRDVAAVRCFPPYGAESCLADVGGFPAGTGSRVAQSVAQPRDGFAGRLREIECVPQAEAVCGSARSLGLGERPPSRCGTWIGSLDNPIYRPRGRCPRPAGPPPRGEFARGWLCLDCARNSPGHLGSDHAMSRIAVSVGASSGTPELDANTGSTIALRLR